MPLDIIGGCYTTSHMSTMDVRSNQRWSIASTITSWHHLHLIEMSKKITCLSLFGVTE